MLSVNRKPFLLCVWCMCDFMGVSARLHEGAHSRMFVHRGQEFSHVSHSVALYLTESVARTYIFSCSISLFHLHGTKFEELCCCKCLAFTWHSEDLNVSFYAYIPGNLLTHQTSGQKMVFLPFNIWATLLK